MKPPRRKAYIQLSDHFLVSPNYSIIPLCDTVSFSPEERLGPFFRQKEILISFINRRKSCLYLFTLRRKWMVTELHYPVGNSTSASLQTNSQSSLFTCLSQNATGRNAPPPIPKTVPAGSSHSQPNGHFTIPQELYQSNRGNHEASSFVNSAVTVLFIKLPAEMFLALPGTIPENVMKPSMDNSPWGSFQPPAERWTAALWIALCKPSLHIFFQHYATFTL